MGGFLEVLAPALCAACNLYGGVQVGVNLRDVVDVGIGWVDHHYGAGHMDDDTLRASLAVRLLRWGRFDAGLYAAGTFCPDGKAVCRTPLEVGPFGGVHITEPLSVRGYVSRHQQQIAVQWRF